MQYMCDVYNLRCPLLSALICFLVLTLDFLSILLMMYLSARSGSESGDTDAEDTSLALRLFQKSLSLADCYPTNIVYSRNYGYQLGEYEWQLHDDRSRLFGHANAVDLLEFREGTGGTGLLAKRLRHKEDLATVGMHKESNQADPLCRFIFVSAPSSRDRLNIDHCMLTRILTWHQMMPEVVDFLLAFGISEYPKDFHYSGFRSEMNLNQESNRLTLESLGRSGRELRLCHILRSVERVDVTGKSPQSWPWSLRPTVTYHSFDIESQRSVWLIVKANGVIKSRVRSTCKDQNLYRLSPADSVDNTFESTLRTHLVLCAWAGENWRWYINDIEQRVQTLTREALTESMDETTLLTEYLPQDKNETQAELASEDKVKSGRRARLSFEHLQEVHYVEEKANEGLLVLRANAAVIQELRDFYVEVTTALHATPECIKPSLSAMAAFQRHLDTTAKDLAMQQARLQVLLQLLVDRRALLESMLQWRNAQLNFFLAQRAQTSATNMEKMTEAMHTIAYQTKMEAANMRIITLVTLFFLPGTFVSTLMSTPIVNYPDDHRIINRDALFLFLAMALPLLVITIVVWLALYWYKKRTEELERQVQSAQNTV